MNHRRTLSVLLGVLFAASSAAAQTLFPFNHARNVNPDVQAQDHFQSTSDRREVGPGASV
jgi:hypothetical protein